MPEAVFPISVWCQPNTSAKTWASRGVNTSITGTSEPRNVPMLDYFKAWSDAGCKVLAYPSSNPTTDSQLNGFGGFAQPDEPDGWNHIPGGIDVNNEPKTNANVAAAIASYVKTYTDLKAKVPSSKVFGNFTGSSITSARTNSKVPNQPFWKQTYIDWFRGTDIVSFDWYLTNTGRAVNAGTLRNCIGEATNRCLQWSNGKEVWACLECSNQGLQANSREPTDKEFLAQTWMAIIRGVKGLMYFPQKVSGGFKYDNMSSGLAATMTLNNKTIQQYADYLLNGMRVPGSDANYEWGTWETSRGILTTSIDVNTLEVHFDENRKRAIEKVVVYYSDGSSQRIE